MNKTLTRYQVYIEDADGNICTAGNRMPAISASDAMQKFMEKNPDTPLEKMIGVVAGSTYGQFAGVIRYESPFYKGKLTLPKPDAQIPIL